MTNAIKIKIAFRSSHLHNISNEGKKRSNSRTTYINYLLRLFLLCILKAWGMVRGILSNGTERMQLRT
jgi:hypothetical protein